MDATSFQRFGSQTTPTRSRFAILGDVHANLEALTAVLEDARKQECTHFACVGDLVGYNANPRECLELLRNSGMPCAKGNHDEYSANTESLSGFNPRAAAAVEWTRKQLSEPDKEWLRALKYVQVVAGFTIVHATLDEPNRWGYIFDRSAAAASFTYQTTPLCFYGHTHVPMAFVRDDGVQATNYGTLKIVAGRKYLINVGSVGEPRDGNPLAAYAIYDLSVSSVTLRRVKFDTEATLAKARAAGLPPRR